MKVSRLFLTFVFVHSVDGDALLSKIPHQIWNDLGVDPTQAATSVTAGRIRRLISHGKVLVTQFQTSGRAPAGTPNAGILCPPSWQEHAPPRLTPESVAALSAMFTKNFPGELLIAEALPSTRLLSIRLLSIIHHQLQPGQTLRYVPWQLRLSQKQCQEMMEAKTPQLLGVIWDDTPELPLDQVRLSAEWLMKVQQVFRNAFVMCGAAHLHTFKKFDQKVFDLAMKKHSPDPDLRAASLSELLEADKAIWAEIISLVGQGWTLDDSLHELTTARADIYGLLQPRPKSAGQCQ